MAMLYINGAQMPSPAEFSVELEDVGDARCGRRLFTDALGRSGQGGRGSDVGKIMRNAEC